MGSKILNIPPVFWAKYVPPKSGQSAQWLPLWAHCLDVAMVFRALCDLPAISRSLSRQALQDLPSDALDRLAFLAGVHDIGKANLGFQLKVLNPDAPQPGHVRELAPIFDSDASDDRLATTFLSCLPSNMETWFASDEVAYSYFMMAFSHHGRPLRFYGERTGFFSVARDTWWQTNYGLNPFDAVEQVVQWLSRAFPSVERPTLVPLPTAAGFHHRVAGLLMLADWLGSHQDWFPVTMVEFEERYARNQHAIPRLLRDVGLDVSSLRRASTEIPLSFAARFGFSPRPVQRLMSELSVDDKGAELCIIESDTGSGKTEAALEWFYKLFHAGKVDSLYFALPTRVAARELHLRIEAIIKRWFPELSLQPAVVLAVPGYPEPTLPPQTTLPTPEQGRLWSDDDTGYGSDMRRWAAERPKRYLAATIAVGTIDQALLSVVQTAHAHLRSICLDRSLLVIDEVHASDAYASRLIETLVGHHRDVGGYAVLLSATLGISAQARFVARGSHEMLSLPESFREPYPLITLGTGRKLAADAVSTGKRVRFETVPALHALHNTGDLIVDALNHNARILVIANTVRRAVALFQALEPQVGPAMFRCQNVTAPHHGRFAPADRVVLDRAVSARFGAHGSPGPLLLIGTQTLEQSLDIDADFLVTDLCPADVLLQRVGRLHRHARSRPSGFRDARCLVLVPEEDLQNSLDRQGTVSPRLRREGLGSVYADLRMVELTRRLLEEGVFTFPQDNRRFVESAVHPEALKSLTGSRWDAHGQRMDGEVLAKVIAASSAIANYDEYFGQFAFTELGERIVTRLGMDSLQLPLESPIVSPFGATIYDMVIPGHMRPHQPCETIGIDASLDDREWQLRCGERRYRYSHVGLEMLSE